MDTGKHASAMLKLAASSQKRPTPPEETLDPTKKPRIDEDEDTENILATMDLQEASKGTRKIKEYFKPVDRPSRTQSLHANGNGIVFIVDDDDDEGKPPTKVHPKRDYGALHKSHIPTKSEKLDNHRSKYRLPPSESESEDEWEEGESLHSDDEDDDDDDDCIVSNTSDDDFVVKELNNHGVSITDISNDLENWDEVPEDITSNIVSEWKSLRKAFIKNLDYTFARFWLAEKIKKHSYKTRDGIMDDFDKTAPNHKRSAWVVASRLHRQLLASSEKATPAKASVEPPSLPPPQHSDLGK